MRASQSRWTQISREFPTAIPEPKPSLDPLAFYCVVDSRHFWGLVALVNSLRLVGHDEPVYVLDCGLATWQQHALSQDAEVVITAAEAGIHPLLGKTVLPLRRPSAVMVVVDVDVIVTGRLDALVAAAVEKPLLFPNDQTARFHTGWAKLGYGPPVKHLYVASGQFVLPLGSSLGFLQTWSEGLGRFAAEPALGARALSPEDDAFYYPDMDVLNAMIGTALPLDSYALADASTVAYWPFRGLRVLDPERLEVEASDGTRPTLLHHILDKPWNTPVAPNAYSSLMIRLLCDSDLSIRLPAARIPCALRRGIGAAARRHAISRYGFRSASVVNWASAAGWRAGTPPRFGRDIGAFDRVRTRHLPAGSISESRDGDEQWTHLSYELGRSLQSVNRASVRITWRPPHSAPIRRHTLGSITACGSSRISANRSDNT